MPIRLYLASLLLLCSQLGQAAAALKLLTEDYPPFNMVGQGGHISGLSTEIVQELFHRAGVSYGISLLPWIRAFNLTVLEANTCLYSTTRTDSREHQFKWIGPLVENPWVLYARADNRHAILALEDARPFKIGGYAGDATSQYLIDRGFDVDLANTDQLNVKKLLAGRIDFWATGKYLGASLLVRENASHVRPVLTFNTTLLYLACNPAMPDSQVQQLNELLRGMQRDGTLARINAKYLNQKD
ncbi:substrate-binding periplasmic protein [Aquitalea magnusonii]|uniref:Amino acid ABC transporter substrate-binding protein (PAAT family) n=1 Tax=Aquitalea magnusonii TaxID=332411 RepID=A0A318J9Y3_9NEIS|nr:transporter substrate-binding domain-containing protein [Aquitalea magnusonii]PXX43628.1 amino acid ABC transporter substrate-binding protein (PAAT family) [Aquitalea magnusonii]